MFLSRTSILTCNRQIDFLSLNKLRFWLFLMLETFVVFLVKIFRMCFHWIVYKSLIYTSCILDNVSEYVIYIHTTRIKAIVRSKTTDFTFCWEKEQILDKSIKSKRLKIKTCRISMTIFFQTLNAKPILIICVQLVR